ncbi:hypothetical protein [Nocardia sp. NPDC058633]|uniref:hypothetical protein n=1 Tax=Nocardia sp. NPDC058633 TaxID=3346568 RepID=UPI00364E1B05
MTAQTAQTTTEFTTARGRTVRIGQHYRDARESNVRDLVVESIGVYAPPEIRGVQKPPICSVTCTVTRTTDAGTELMRPTTMSAERMTGKEFRLVEEYRGDRAVVVVELPTEDGTL